MAIKILSKLKLIGINVAVFALLWLLLELLLHFIFITVKHPKIANFASYHQLLHYNNVPLYTPHRYLGYIPTPGAIKGKNKHNNLGYRGEEILIPKPDSVFRIVCLGGSTTYTVKVSDFRQSYPNLLEKQLQEKGFQHIEVVNAGAGGWSSWESFINLQLRLLSLEPDLLVVYHGINDVHARVVWPPAAYQSDNSGRRIAKGTPTNHWGKFFLQKSNIIRIFQVSSGNKAPARTFRSFDDYPPTLHMYELDQQFRKKTYPTGIFKEVPLAKMIATNKPIYFQENIEGLITLAKANDIKIMLATFAYRRADQNYITFEPAYQMALEEQNTLLTQISQNEAIPIFDFASAFPQDSSLYADAIHVNEKGSALKAGLFADFIIVHFLKH